MVPRQVRKQHAAATRAVIVRTARLLLGEVPPLAFSHEAVAANAGIAPRTVYRYFPTQADLVAAVWAQWTEELSLRFPASAEEVPEWAARLFRCFDKEAPVVRAWLAAETGRGTRRAEAVADRENWTHLLRPLVARLTPPERGRVIAAVRVLCSASTWRELRGAGQLSGEGAAVAVEWATRALLDALRRIPRRGN
jgi:AcrR family transcriptional regulator